MYMKHILILITSILLLPTTLHAQTLLTPEEFQNKISATTGEQLLDVRTPEEYKQGHLENANNIDYRNPAFRDRIKTLDRNKPVFVYCLAGGRSAAAALILHENGFREVYDMKGGFIKWTAGGKLIDAPEKTLGIKGISSSDYKKLINTNRVVLIDFYAQWCDPCIKMLPTVHKLTAEYKAIAKIITLSYDANKKLAKELGIEEIPAFLVYKNGKLTERRTGFMEESEFRKLLDKNSK